MKKTVTLPALTAYFLLCGCKSKQIPEASGGNINYRSEVRWLSKDGEVKKDMFTHGDTLFVIKDTLFIKKPVQSL